MSFFAVLLALLAEQLRPLPRDNWVHDTLISWVGWTGRNFDAGRERHAIVVWCITVLAPALAATALYLLAAHYSLALALAVNVGVLYLTLGFRQFSHYFTDICDALARGEEDEARRLLGQWRHLDASELPHTVTSSAYSSASSCFRRSGSGPLAPWPTAWPSSPAAIGRSRAVRSTRRPISA